MSDSAEAASRQTDAIGRSAVAEKSTARCNKLHHSCITRSFLRMSDLGKKERMEKKKVRDRLR